MQPPPPHPVPLPQHARAGVEQGRESEEQGRHRVPLVQLAGRVQRRGWRGRWGQEALQRLTGMRAMTTMLRCHAT